MKYRKLTSTGDYSFGQSAANFYVDEPLVVGQSVQTRLELWEGEWYLDKNEGTPWSQEVFGTRSNPTYDMAIQARILETTGVTRLVSYSSSLGGNGARGLVVRAQIVTEFSSDAITVEANL
jgi:hypothetical protein